jgi:hypothetical protein
MSRSFNVKSSALPPTSFVAEKEKLDAIMRSDVGAFNERLKGAHVPHVGVRVMTPSS